MTDVALELSDLGAAMAIGGGCFMVTAIVGNSAYSMIMMAVARGLDFGCRRSERWSVLRSLQEINGC